MASRDAPARGARPTPFDRRLLDTVPAARVGLGLSVALGLISTAAVAAQAVALARLLASAMPGGSPAGRRGDFVVLGAGVVLRAATALAAEVTQRVGAAVAKAQLRTRLLESALRAAPRDGESPGVVAALAGRGLDALDVYLGRCVPDLVLAALAPVALLVVAGVLDWVSAAILAVCLALFPIFGALVGRASTTLARERWHQVESLGRQVHDVFAGLAVLKAFGRAGVERARLARASEVLATESLKTLRVAFVSALVLDTLASVSVALVAVPLGLRLLGGAVALPAALAVLIVAPEVFLPMRRASAEFHESTEGLAAAARVLDAIGSRDAAGDRDAESLPRPSLRSVAPDPRLVPVALRGVTLTPSGRAVPVLDDATLEIAPGSTVALVGANGVGKSTVAALLLGYLTPQHGLVVAGDVALSSVDPDAWRARLGYLPEHPTLLAASLAENLRLAAPWASDDELADALARVGARDLLDRLPAGLATRLGDGGRPASAGERQLVALARIVLRGAALSILDEPTAHLSPAAERRAVSGLSRALAGRSTLLITHRSAPLALADRVVALEGGRIVDFPEAAAHAPLAGAPSTVAALTSADASA